MSRRRELRVGRDDQDVGVAQHLRRLERPFGQRQVGEREVELAVLEQAEQVGGVRLLVHLHVDARPLLAEAAEQCGEDARADALIDADPQRAGGTLGERGHVGLGGVELRDDRVGVAEEQTARVGEVDAAWAARPLDELLADDALELGDLLADRRLCVAELARSTAERAVPRDGVERHQMAQLDACPSITFHDQYES